VLAPSALFAIIGLFALGKKERKKKGIVTSLKTPAEVTPCSLCRDIPAQELETIHA
jgi:cytidine deaminase